jgi:hypothetical protein
MGVRDNRKTDFNIHERREMNKHSLATYAMDKWNNLDSTLDSIIKKLEAENKESIDRHEGMNSLYKKNHGRFMEIADQAGMSEMELLRQADDNLIDIAYTDEEIFALVELKIIYAFKHLEFNIKRLINSAYPGTPTRDFYKWDNIKFFLKSKLVDMNAIEEYKDVDQLRIVNNFLKHSINIDELSASKIIEFKEQAYITYVELKTFYSRVKDAPNKFLGSLAFAIYNEQFEFTQEKLYVIAESLALRMNEKTALEFCRLLTSFYSPEGD